MSTKYIGKELEVFKDAKNWKNYWLKKINKYIKGNVAEVGAGLGVNTKLFLENCGTIQKLTAIEPDHDLANQISLNVGNYQNKLIIVKGYLKDISSNVLFDTIVYIDVIEHIELDSIEVKNAISFLKPGGHLIILVPAHNYLLSPFDKAVGHFRRYNKSQLQNLVGKNDCMLKKELFYLDSLGLLASLVNKYLIKGEYPSKNQIFFWDRILIKISKFIDFLIGYSNGKTLIGVWIKK